MCILGVANILANFCQVCQNMLHYGCDSAIMQRHYMTLNLRPGKTSETLFYATKSRRRETTQTTTYYRRLYRRHNAMSLQRPANFHMPPTGNELRRCEKTSRQPQSDERLSSGSGYIMICFIYFDSVYLI